ncbi:MAG TPA: hypothetical protein VF613_16400 [Longimicrobium sp.]|jgi:hypothetical protein
MPNDFPIFKALLLLTLFMVVVGTAGSYLTGHGERPGRGRAAAGNAAAPAAPVAATPLAPARTAVKPASTELCRVETSGVALPETVHESSGVAAAGGVLWTHNDSGDPALVAVGIDGGARGTVRVTGATVQDWEDVASGPCPGGRCLFVADIGDNAAARPRVTVYRVPEPAPGDAASRPAEAFHATYPEGPQDAEALFVTPDGTVYIVTKGETGPVAVYRFPQPMQAGTVARLERIRVLAGEQGQRRERITGASASADGQWVVLRTLRELSFYRARELTSPTAPATPLVFDVSPLNEAQGEAVSFGGSGTLYLTSEGGKKKDPATLSRLSCTLPA